MRHFFTLLLLQALLCLSNAWAPLLQAHADPALPDLTADPATAFPYAFFREHPAVMLLIDADTGAILDANAAAERFYGYSGLEFRALSIQDINSLPRHETRKLIDLAAAHRQNTFTFEHRLASGETRTVETTTWPFTIQGRRVLFSIYQDATPRLEAMEALRQEREGLEKQVLRQTAELRERNRQTTWSLFLGVGLLSAALLALLLRNRQLQATRNSWRDQSLLLKAILDSSPDIILYKDRNGVYLGGNPEFERRSGHAIADIIGKTDDDLFPPDVAELYRRQDREILESGQPGKTTEWADYPDGSRILIDKSKVPIRTPEGKVIGLVASCRNVTGEYEAWARVDQVSRHLPGMLYQYRLRPDGSSHFPFSSQGIEWIYGASPQEVEQDCARVFAAVHPDDLERVRESIMQSAQDLGVWRCVYRVLHPERGQLWVTGHATPQRDPDGSVLWHGAILDITEQKQAEEELHRQHAMLTAILDNAPIGIWLTDDKHNFLLANRKCEEDYGL